MSRPRVFIPQEPVRRNADTGIMEPVMDLRPVLKYGDPVVCLKSGRVSLTPGPTIDALKHALRDFNDEDYVVSIGDPSAIFIMAMVIGQLNRNRCKLLKWDRVSKEYICVNIDLNYHRKENFRDERHSE